MSDEQQATFAFPAQAKWREKNPLKVWAQAALRSAVKRGLVQQRPCQECGAEPAEAHHPDYSKPADVVWLCRLHHRRHHALERRGDADE